MANHNQYGPNNPFWKGGLSEYDCLECGKKFKAIASERQRGGAKFCSTECGYENKRIRIGFKCDWCGNESSKRKSDFIKSKKHFCSRECYWKYSKTIRGERHHMTGRKFSEEHCLKISAALSG